MFIKFIERFAMAKSVELSENFITEATIISKVLKRSVGNQIEYWAKIGRLAEENPDLTYEFIKNILIAQEEAEAGQVTPYSFD